MKVLLSWLNEFGPFADPADNDAVEAVAADLTALGLAVEETIAIGSPVEGVVSARVLRVEQHQMRRRFVVCGLTLVMVTSATCGVVHRICPLVMLYRSQR